MSRVHLRPLSSNVSHMTGRIREEDLINAFEADQERITLTLSRKLEQLRNEKVQLENTLEAESESHVLRLSRQLSALRQQQAQHQQNHYTNGAGPSNASISSVVAHGDLSWSAASVGLDPRYPSADAILDALRRENDSLRQRLNNTEQDYVRLARLNDIYREELIEHRRRLGISVDNLIGMSAASATHSPASSLSQPTHLRAQPSAYVSISSSEASSIASSPESAPTLPNRATGATPIPIHPQSTGNTAVGLPIPRTGAYNQRRVAALSLTASTSTSSSATSPSSSVPPSPFPSSPINHMMHESSYQTQATTPPSSTSPFMPMQGFAFQPMQQLSYPSVPPPSLSSSVGSPIVSRRNSMGQGARRMSVSTGGRVAETGNLLAGRNGVRGGIPPDIGE